MHYDNVTVQAMFHAMFVNIMLCFVIVIQLVELEIVLLVVYKAIHVCHIWIYMDICVHNIYLGT